MIHLHVSTHHTTKHQSFDSNLTSSWKHDPNQYDWRLDRSTKHKSREQAGSNRACWKTNMESWPNKFRFVTNITNTPKTRMLHLVLCSNSVVVASAVILSHPSVLSWIPPLDHSSSSHTRHSRNTLSSWRRYCYSVHSWSYTLQDLHEPTSRVLSQLQNSCSTWKDLRRCPSH